MTQQREEDVSWYFLLFSGLLGLVFALSKILDDHPRLRTVLSEAALVLLIGMGAGSLAHFFLADTQEEYPEPDDDQAEAPAYVVAQSLLSFRPNIFFMALMPPIIFNSGYQLRRELFLRHIKPIVMFACLGTILSSLVTATILVVVNYLGGMGDFQPTNLELFTFGSLIAATDSVAVLAVLQTKRVDSHLFYLVFGESALNDAVALILFQTFSDLLSANYENMDSIAHQCLALVGEFVGAAVASPILGIVFALASALVFKYVDFRQHPMLELPLFMLIMYMPFVLAECLHLNGIVTIFFSGLSSRRYVAPNTSAATQGNVELIFQLAAYLAEICIFLELGLSVFGFSGSFKGLFIFWALIAAWLGRAAGIYPLAAIHNMFLVNKSASRDREMDDPVLHHRAMIEWDDRCRGDSPPSSESMENPACSDASLRPEVSSRSAQGPPVDAPPREVWPIEKRPDKRISVNKMHVMWFAGLRGAVAYACSKQFPDVHFHTNVFIATTMIIVLVSIVVMGGATGEFLRIMGIKMNVVEEDIMEDWQQKGGMKGTFYRMERHYLYDQVVRETSHVTMEHHDSTGDASKSFDYQLEPRTSETLDDRPPAATTTTCNIPPLEGTDPPVI